MEFSALEVGLLESPCDLSPSPRVEIDFEGPSLIFDFSTVERPGRFPDAEFDGYHFGLSDPAGEIYLITARVDELESSVRPTRVEVSNNPPRIDVSFDGSDYDDSGFAKIDLWFGRVEHTGDEAR